MERINTLSPQIQRRIEELKKARLICGAPADLRQQRTYKLPWGMREPTDPELVHDFLRQDDFPYLA